MIEKFRKLLEEHCNIMDEKMDEILQFTFEPYYAILSMLGLPGIWY